MRILVVILIIVSVGACTKNTEQPKNESQYLSSEWTATYPSGSAQVANFLYKEEVILVLTDQNNTANLPLVSSYDKNNGTILWNWDGAGYDEYNITRAIIQDDKIILLAPKGILALNLESKQIDWKYDFKAEESINSQISSDQKSVFLSIAINLNGNGVPFQDSSHLALFDINTGDKSVLIGHRKSATKQESASFYPPLRTVNGGDELLVFQIGYLSPIIPREALTNDLVAFNLTTNNIEWIDSAFCELSSGANWSPLLHNEDINTLSDWSLYSYDLSSGVLNWRHEFEEVSPRSGFSFSGPVKYEDNIYCTSDGGQIYKVNASTGNRVWSNTMDDQNIPNSGPAKGAQPQVLKVDDLLIVNSYSRSQILIFDDDDGTLLEVISGLDVKGNNILYDNETEQLITISKDKILSFKLIN